MKCERCGSWDAMQVMMAGRRAALLCPSCGDAWHEHCLRSAAFKRCRDLDAEEEYLKHHQGQPNPPGVDQWREFLHRRQAAQDALRAEAAAWVRLRPEAVEEQAAE